MVVADDSGLEIDYLNGAPGIYSARFLGDRTDIERYEGILNLLKGVPEEYRSARFRCVASLVTDTVEMTFSGTLEGFIALKPEGNNGFGYDPIFIPDGYDQTFAEMSLEEKNKISHRSKAVSKLVEFLNSQQ